jgi:hypothetical protein
MGFRYRSSIRLARGLRINLSKSGASLSVGGRGATLNLSKRGVRTTVGLPGTGISYSESAPWHSGGRPRGEALAEPARPIEGPVQRATTTGAVIALLLILLVLAAFGA